MCGDMKIGADALAEVDDDIFYKKDKDFLARCQSQRRCPAVLSADPS
jgi:hypothetical protein